MKKQPTKKTIVEKLIRGEGDEAQLVGYKITKFEEKPFVVPVVDVRRNAEERKVAQQMQKDSNGSQSKFFKQSYSWYGWSYNMKRNPL